MNGVLVVLLTFGVGVVCRAQETYQVETNQSVIQVHVGTAGPLGFVGHSHLIQTPVEQGTFIYYPTNPGKSTVVLVVKAGTLQVMDPKLAAKDKAEISAKMHGDRVLSTGQYPKIVFTSTAVEALDRTHLRVTGDLTIRDQTNRVTVQVALEQLSTQLKATGKSQFKQTTFGIRPVAAGAGTVRVKDEMEISFDLTFHN